MYYSFKNASVKFISSHVIVFVQLERNPGNRDLRGYSRKVKNDMIIQEFFSKK